MALLSDAAGCPQDEREGKSESATVTFAQQRVHLLLLEPTMLFVRSSLCKGNGLRRISLFFPRHPLPLFRSSLSSRLLNL